MPQLTFSNEQCPAKLRIELHWDQLLDKWYIHALCFAQNEQLQAVASLNLPDSFRTVELGMCVERLIEDWCDVTPGYALAQFTKSIHHLNPVEVPVGLEPHTGPIQTGPPVAGAPRYTKRIYPPRIR